MSTNVFKYILSFQADAQKFGKEVGGVQGILKGAAVAAGALFAADKILDAAKAVGDYALEISKVKNEVETLTGLSGAQADAMAGGAEAIKTAYGSEVSEAIKASNVLMRQFGETSQSSFDILNAGLAGAANANGDFLEQIREYSTHFREAGLNAQQMLAILNQGGQTGVFSDKAADAIKEGSIRLREMTTSTQDALNAIGLSSTQIQQDISSGNKSMFEVMQLVSKQLQTLPQQSPAVGTALADIFGGPGEDAVEFIRALADIDTSMEGMLSNLTDAQKAQMAFTDELQEFHTIGAQVFGGTGEMVTRIKTVFLGFVNDAIRGAVQVINYFIDLYNESMVFRAAIEYIKFTFQTTWNFISTILKNLWEQLKGTGKLIKAVFTGDLKSIPGIINETFKGVVTNFKDFGTDAADRFKQGVENVLNPREKIELVTLSTDAEPAGVKDGASYAKGFKKGAGVISFNFTAAAKLSEEIDPDIAKEQAAMFKNVDAEINKELATIGADADLSGLDSFITAWDKKMNYLKEKQEAVKGALTQGFNEIGQSAIKGLGLAEDGFEGFLGKLLSTSIELLSMYLAQSMAASIAGATASGAATGPGAIFTTPAFIATAIAGVLGAFAAIPKFASGAIAYGPTVGMIGEYPGARSNPEVIAPLDKLKGMLAGSGGGRDRLIIPTTRIRKGDIYISYKEAEKEFLMRT